MIYVLDAKRESVYVDGHEIQLTVSQWEIVHALVTSERVISTEELAKLTGLIGIKEAVHRLRQRLGDYDCIRAYHGGYIWNGRTA